MIPVTELEMATNTTFASIIKEIQLSNLNFVIKMTPFAAYITLKKSVQKDLNGVPANPAPSLLYLLQEVQKQNLRLQAENSELRSTIDSLAKKHEYAKHEIVGLAESLEETKKSVANLTSTNNVLTNRIDKAEKESAKHELNWKENRKKHTSEVIELQAQIKDLKVAKKMKEKENHDINKALENARITIRSLKEEKSQLKTCKTQLETKVRKLEKKRKNETIVKTIKSQNKDENSNLKTLNQVTYSHTPSLIPSMVSHHNPHFVQTFQKPTSVTSMISHCVQSPPPGSSFLSMKEIIEAFEKAAEKMMQSMKCLNRSTF